MKRIYYLLFLWALIGFSCTEDLGNYDYNEVNQIRIGEMKDTSVIYHKRLRLEPKVENTFNVGEEQLEYVWYAYLKEQVGADTLSRSRILDTEIDLYPEIYKIVLKVTDRNTGLFSEFTFNLEVLSGDFAKGVLILRDVEGVARVGILNSDGVFYPEIPMKGVGKYVAKNPYRIIPKMERTFKNIQYYWFACHDDQGGYLVEPKNLQSDSVTCATFFAIEPDEFGGETYNYDLGIMGVSPMSGRNYYILNNGIPYHCRTDVPGDKVEEFSGTYRLAPFIFSVSQPPIGSLVSFYDNLNKIFYCWRGDKALTKAKENKTAKFNPAKVGLEMVFAEEAYNGTFLSICRDTVTGAPFMLSYWVNGSGVAPANKIALSAVAGGATAHTFSAYRMNNHLYYASGNTVYCLDASAEIPSLLGQPYRFEDEVDFIKFHTGKTTAEKNVLWVVTSKGGGEAKKSTLHICNVSSGGGIISVDPVLASEFSGKVVDLYYKK